MPQDSLRSTVYRSFVTCDDPNGVVECGTIRSSKSGSEKMEHNEGRKSRSNQYAARKAEREELVAREAVEASHSSSSCQLMEVSKGAHKLNRVIDSWSKSIWCHGRSNDIAEDLLKGALDLQESLHMLGKLHEASHYMTRLKKKEQEKCDRARNDQVIQRTNSSPVGERRGYQNPRLSADGSSRGCIEELRKVIRDSLARQNLLPNVNVIERRYFSSRYIESASDIPFTNSSQSLRIQTDNFSLVDSSISSGALEKNTGGPSLVAKLMGVEEMPSKPLLQNSQRELGGKKIFSQQRPIFEINKPKIRKPQFVLTKEVPERRTLKEILETSHFKGLLNSNSTKEIKYDSELSSDIFPEWRLINDSTPIVLIKPRQNPHLQQQENFASMFQEKRTSVAESKIKKLKGKEEVTSKITDYSNRSLNSNEMRRVKAEDNLIKKPSQQEGAKNNKEKESSSRSLNLNEMSRRVEAAETAVKRLEMSRRVEAAETTVKRLSQQEGAKDSKEKKGSNKSLYLNEMSRRMGTEETSVKRLSQQEGAKDSKEKKGSNKSLNLNEMSRRVGAEETSVKRLSQQEGAKESKENERGLLKKEVKTKQRLSTKTKSLVSITRPPLKKEANDKGTDKLAKPSISNKKPVENEVAKARNVSKSKDQSKVTPPKPIKPEKASNVRKNKVSHQRSFTPNSNSNHIPQKTIVHGCERKKSPIKMENTVNKTTAAKIITEKLDDKGGNERINLASENGTILEVCIETEDQLPKREGTYHIDIEIGVEHLDKSVSSACDITLVTADDWNNSKSIEEVDEDSIIAIGTDSESLMTEIGLKALLLSSPAFLNHVEELFNLNMNVSTTSRKFDISDFTEADAQLSLDCAKEIVRRRSSPDVQVIHPPLLMVGNSKSCICLERLVKETWDAIEALRSYSELAGGNHGIDSFYAMLERDITSSEVLSAIWDLGWRKGFTVDNTMQVVDDIENQLLSGLIEEICA